MSRKNLMLLVLGAVLFVVVFSDPPKSEATNLNTATVARLRWETIERSGRNSLYRTKVPGGWLVKSTEVQTDNNGIGVGVGLTFVPDKSHFWSLDD